MDIIIQHRGKTYTGWRSICEKRGKRFQIIHYKGHRDADSCGYRSHQTDYMDFMAEIILGQLIDRVESIAVKGQVDRTGYGPC